MRYRCGLPALMALGLMAGCQYALPQGYVKAGAEYGERLHAVSAEGSAVTLRTEENPENGDLTFWEKAVKGRLVDVRGYRLIDRKDITSGRLGGVEMTFDYERGGMTYAYVVMLFVDGRKVHCIEIAGQNKQIEPELPGIKEAIGKWTL